MLGICLGPRSPNRLCSLKARSFQLGQRRGSAFGCFERLCLDIPGSGLGAVES